MWARCRRTIGHEDDDATPSVGDLPQLCSQGRRIDLCDLFGAAVTGYRAHDGNGGGSPCQEWISGTIRSGGALVESLEEQARRKGVRPVASVHDLARAGAWESDEELDAFLDHVHTARQAETA